MIQLDYGVLSSVATFLVGMGMILGSLGIVILVCCIVFSMGNR